MLDMRNIKIILLALFLAGCSRKPELNEILVQSLGYAPEKPYKIVGHKRSPRFLDAWNGYNESFQLELDEQDYKELLEAVNTRWKLQPRYKEGSDRWERISVIRKFGVTSIASVSSDSMRVYIHVSE